MIEKCQCQWCSGDIQFDSAEFQESGESTDRILGQRVPCPHCGKETILNLDKGESSESPSTQHVPVGIVVEEPPFLASPPKLGNLWTCRDCGGQLSINAEACPHCGARLKKPHGVFFYVFWGVISLIITCFILSFVLLAIPTAISSFVEARQRSQEIRSQQQGGNGTAITNQDSVVGGDVNDPKADYIKNNLVLYGFSAHYQDSELEGRIHGVDFKIKNTGSQTLSEIEVTVYFQDAFGNTIHEGKFYPVLVNEFSTGNQPLKPGYIWQQEAGKFYAAKNVPSEWRDGAATAKITDIKFEGAK